MIKFGELRPRDPVPSESQQQQEHGVSGGTVRRALDIFGMKGCRDHLWPGNVRRTAALAAHGLAADTRLHAELALTSWRIGWEQTMQPRTR